MARLDPIIQRLLITEGLEAFFQSGGYPILRTPTSTGQLLKQPLDSAQIVAAFAEIVPEQLRAQFPAEGTARWSYAGPAGTVRIQFNKRSDRVSASIRPASGDLHDDTVTEKLPVLVKQADPSAPRFVPRAPSRLDGPAMPVPSPNEAVSPSAQTILDSPDPSPVPANEPTIRVLRPQPPEPPVVVAADPAQAMRQLLELMLKRGASDLHLSSEMVPVMRIDGEMTPHPEWRALGPERLKSMIWSIIPERNREEWEARKDTDFAHETEQARFRVNLFADRKGIGAVFRQIPTTIRSAAELGLPSAVMELCTLSKGLVLVTGPTGSGKSTTLASMIDHINQSRGDHIITIEDPIEFVHPNKKCLVNQREVGVHTASFKQALRAALREDPDVLLVGELRDLETISIALETAETGHLVFGTLHTNTAHSTVDRIIDQFPADRQPQIRTMLSESLKGVVAQTLCKRIGGGRVAAHEVLLVNSAVANVIREGKTYQLPSSMQTGKALGMSTLNDALLDLVKRNLVDPAHALQKAVARAEFRSMLERSGIKLEEAGPAPTAAA